MAQVDVSNSNGEHFAKTFFDTIRAQQGNLFFSPLSIETVLSLTYLGSGGETATQLQTALKLPDRDGIYKQAKTVSSMVETNKDGVLLNIANGVFANQGFPILDSYIKTAKEHFDAEVQDVPFGKGDEALSIINSWVDKKTNHKIPSLLPSGSVDASTALVLVNAIYFKGKWAKQFSAKSTQPGPFYLNEKDHVMVNYMTQKDNFRVAQNEDLNAYIVELPYVGNEISMYLIVPKEKTGLKAIEEKIKEIDFAKLTEEMTKREIIITMPKFKIEQTIDLNQPLQALGIKDLFSEEKCDLKGISDGQQLYVSKAIQKSFIEVNEEGSEAAAATGLKVTMRMMPLPPIEIRVQSPFLFVIRHRSGAFLFGGRVSHFA